jgi:sugar/nucleoside kinase (ribokinase family)
VNEDEMALMSPEPMSLAAAAISEGVRCLTVTLGPRGAAYFAAAGFDRLSDMARSMEPAVASGPLRTALIPAVPASDSRSGDPTGCGDVWGATCFSHILRDASIDESIRAANVAAARNVGHKGATGLSHYLRGELSRP